MMEEPLYRDEDLLRRVVEPGADAERFWEMADLGAIADHQLAAELAVDLAQLGPVEAAQAAELGDQATPVIRTFGDLFFHPSPPDQILRHVKRLAEAELHAPEGSLPRPVALLLYDLAIIAARVKCGVRITSVPDAKLAESVAWLLREPWVVGAPRNLLFMGLAEVRKGLESG